MKFSFSANGARLLFAGWLGMSMLAPAAAEAIVPIWYSTTVDTTSSTATFSVKFDRAPDLFTVNAGYAQADSFQFWVDSEAPDAIGRTYAALYGEIPDTTQTVVSAREIPGINQLEIIWPKPLTFPGPRDRGGWGTVEAHTPYSLSVDNVLSFTLPLSLLRDTDGLFYYTFLTLEYGAAGLRDYSGVSGVYYQVDCVPEPSEIILLVAGLAALMARARLRAILATLRRALGRNGAEACGAARNAWARGAARNAWARGAHPTC